MKDIEMNFSKPNQISGSFFFTIGDIELDSMCEVCSIYALSYSNRMLNMKLFLYATKICYMDLIPIC